MSDYSKSFLTSTTDNKYRYYDIRKLDESKVAKLPYSIRVLLEAAVRRCDDFQVKQTDVEKILNWQENQNKSLEIAFVPSRVILQDFTGVPAVVDFAAMRDAVKRLGGNPEKVNPKCPVDLVIDHSVQVDVTKSLDAVKKNQQIEFERNRERFQFLKWGAGALSNMKIVPPGSGIVHQVNLEYLARVIFNEDGILYPDSVVGTDSHTTMINGLGILGWGVGGIEAEAVMLGQAISMVLPEVVGYKLTGNIPQLATSTDVVLAITKNLRKLGVVGKFVEFFGPGVASLSVADRATISNMAPEYGATCGFFAADDMTIKYLEQTARDAGSIDHIVSYLKNSGLWRNYSDAETDPNYTTVVELDLGEVVPSISGPKRPHDRVNVSESKSDFEACLSNPVGFKGFALPKENLKNSSSFNYNGKEYSLTHGSIVISAITSCTNTSNPTVMLGAGLLAKNAVEAGLEMPAYIKTSLSPGSGVVSYYLQASGVDKYLDQLGYQTVGYGCMTCIGNSGPLDENVVKAIEDADLVAASVLSGNRNFEGRVHPHTRANYLASPMLCIAYALAGKIDVDFETEPLSVVNGKEVFLRDIWPARDYIQEIETKVVVPEIFKDCYSKVLDGDDNWKSLQVNKSVTYDWDEKSTYIRHPPFFAKMERDLPEFSTIEKAKALLNVGDSVTTDHISPAGSISRTSPAAAYLKERNVEARMFNSYGSRRGNDEVMARGTFANIRLVNKLAGKNGPFTKHIPTGKIMSVFDASARYQTVEKPLIILAGAAYGSGSSRDWAAKGPFLLGVKAVIAVSYERIHRSNLVGMGIIPCQFLEGQNADSLGLTGEEDFTLSLPEKLTPGSKATVTTDSGKSFEVAVRFDTDVELEYFRHGGILNYMIRSIL